MYKKGFTLAEVLITISIIGIIAALGLPAIQSNVMKQALSTQISKVYSQITNGLNLYMTQEDINKLVESDFDAKEFVQKYLQVNYECNGISDDSCFAKNYDTVKKGNLKTKEALLNPIIPEEQGIYVLKDGTVLSISHDTLTFDVNNTKGPNIIGYDFFSINIGQDGSLATVDTTEYPTPKEREAYVEQLYDNCKAGDCPTGIGCFMHLMRNRYKFDY